MIRLAESLSRQHGLVEVRAHEGSPSLEHAKSHGIEASVLPLRTNGPIDLIKLLFGLFALFGSPRPTSGLVVWTLEGSEHTLCALLRLIWPPFRKSSTLVRLRLGDRVTKRLGLGERLVMGATDWVVFPSQVAANRYFEGRAALCQQLQGRILIQPFCKDFGPSVSEAARGLARDERGPLRAHALFRAAEGRRALVDPHAFVWVSVARFDPVKGLTPLIRAFSEIPRQEGRGAGPQAPPSQMALLLIGRSENVRASELVAVAKESLPGSEVTSQGAIWSVSSESLGRQVLVVDGRLDDLPALLREVDAAVISSLGSEVICRTATEFLQMGLPVVSTRVGSLEETLGSGAFFAEPDGLREAMTAAMEALRHPEQAAMLKERGMVRGQEFRLSGFSRLSSRVSERKLMP